MEYKTKCIIIGRKKNGEENYNALVSLFDENDAHLSGTTPKEVLEFDNIKKVILKKCDKINYFLLGNDLVLNDLTGIGVLQNGNDLMVTKL